MPITMPTYPPPQDFKSIQQSRTDIMERQMAVKGGGKFEVPQTENKASNDNIVASAEMMTKMDKILKAQTAGAKRRKSKRKRKRRFKTYKYLR